MSKRLAGDEHMGNFVYCKQHHYVHRTGWCTVSPDEKVSVPVLTEHQAQEIGRRIEYITENRVRVADNIARAISYLDIHAIASSEGDSGSAEAALKQVRSLLCKSIGIET